MESDKDENGEQHDQSKRNNIYSSKKKKRASVSSDASLEIPSKKQNIEKRRQSFEENADKDLEQPNMPENQKKDYRLDDRNVDDSVHEGKEHAGTSLTSTPKRSKKKRSFSESELAQELHLGSEDEIIPTKASKSDKKSPFFASPLNSSEHEEIVKKDANISYSLESGDSVVKNKKHKKKKKKGAGDNSLTSSDLSGAESFSPEAARHKNRKRSKSLDPYTLNVYDSQSEVLSPLMKNKKKKLYEKNESFLSVDNPLINQTCSADDAIHSDPSGKKKKRKTNEKLFGGNVEREKSDWIKDQHWMHKEKRKKKQKNGQSFEEVASKDSSMVSENGAINEDAIKHVTEEDKQSSKKETDSNDKISDDRIPNSYKNEKSRKRRKSDSSYTIETASSSEEQNEKMKKKLKLSKSSKREFFKKAEKNKVKEKISYATKSENKSEKIKKAHAEKKKKEIHLKSLLSKYEFKSEDKTVKTIRRSAAELDNIGKENEKQIEEKAKPFESSDLSLTELLEDVKDSSRLCDEDVEKLSKLEVMVPWRVTPLHLIETRIAGRPSEKNREQIEALGITVKTGQFSKKEDQQIMNNWKMFYDLHDLSDDPTPFLSFANPERKVIIPMLARINFVRFLARGLENRLLCAVYHRFKRLCLQKTVNSGRFTPKEDEVIIQFLNESTSNTPYSDLAKILNRSKLSIEKRCSKLADKVTGSNATIKWRRELIEEYMKHFVDVTKVKDVEELRTRKITLEEWKKLSERLHIPVEKLRYVWNHNLYSRVFVKRSLQTNEVKEKLVHILIERGEDDWRAINWDKIAEEFEGFTGRKLNRLLKGIVSYHVPFRLQHDLKASLNYLRETPLRLNKIKGHKIRRLKVLDKRQPECAETSS